MFECSGLRGDSGLPTDGFGARSASSYREMRAERALLNRSELDVEMAPHREALAPRGACGYGGPQRVHSAAKGFSSKPLAGTDPRVLRSMSIRARSATGTCRWPG
jgi:hypothetical protein